MTDSYKYKLTSKNLVFLIIATMQEVTFLQITRRAAEHSGHDAWISVLLASTLAFVSIFIINMLCSRFPGLTLAELNDKICGKIIGKMVSFAYIAFTVFYAALVTNIFVVVLNSFLFVRTPSWALSLVIILTITYIFSRDIRAIAWMSEFTQYLVQVLWLILLYGFTKADYQNLLPVGDAGIKNILFGTFGVFFAYIGTEILLVVYPFIQNKKEILKAGILAVAFNAFIYTTIALVVLMVFGDTVRFFVWDFLAMIKTYRLPVVERAEFFVAIFWSWLAIRSSAIQLFMAKHTIAKAAGIKEQYHTYIIWALGMVTFILSLLPRNAAQAFLLTYPLGIAGIFMMVGLPTILWMLSIVRGVKST